MALSHNTLENYFTVNFVMAQHHKYSIAEIEGMVPFERDIYVQMLMSLLKEREKK